jgi:hypothetical protein
MIWRQILDDRLVIIHMAIRHLTHGLKVGVRYTSLSCLPTST